MAFDVLVNSRDLDKLEKDLTDVDTAAKNVLNTNKALSKPIKLGLETSVKDSKSILSDLFEGIKAGAGDTLGSILPLSGGIGSFATAATGAAGVASAAFLAIGGAVLSLTNQYDELRKSVSFFTDATGDELGNLVAKSKGIADTFGAEIQDINIAANALSKNLGVSFEEALTELSRGFASGANISGDFLEQVKEYPSTFQDAGISAKQFTDIIIAQGKAGIKDDFGIDAIKEFNIKIKEQTAATKDALTGAFGNEFTNEILKGVDTGAITTVQALDKIAQKTKDVNLTQQQLQLLKVDVFGSKGEDIGLGFIQSLEGISTASGVASASLTDLAKKQLQIIEANTALAAEQEKFTRAFAGTGAAINLLITQAQTLFFSVLNKGFETIQPIIDALQRLGAEVASVFSGITDTGIIDSFLKGVSAGFALLADVITLVIDGLTFAISTAKELPVVRFVIDSIVHSVNTWLNAIQQIPAVFSGVVAFIRQGATNIKDFFKELYLEAQVFIKQIDQTFRIRADKRLEIQNEIDRLNKQIDTLGNGKKAGDAFMEAYTNSIKGGAKETQKQVTKTTTPTTPTAVKAKAKTTEKEAKTTEKDDTVKQLREIEKLKIDAITDENERKIALIRFNLKAEIEDYKGAENIKKDFVLLKETEAAKQIAAIQNAAFQKQIKEREALQNQIQSYEADRVKERLSFELEQLKQAGADKYQILQKQREIDLRENELLLQSELKDAEEYARAKAKISGGRLDIVGAQSGLEQAAAIREASIKIKFAYDIQEAKLSEAVQELNRVIESGDVESQIKTAGFLTELEGRLQRGTVTQKEYEKQKAAFEKAGELERLQIRQQAAASELVILQNALTEEELTEQRRAELLKKQQALRLETANVAMAAAKLATDADKQNVASFEDYVSAAKTIVSASAQGIAAVSEFVKEKDTEVTNTQISNAERRIEELIALGEQGSAEQIAIEKDRLATLLKEKEDAARKEAAIANIVASAQYAVAVAEGVVAIAKAAQLPFPANIAAIAATVIGLGAGTLGLISKFQSAQSASATGFYDGGYTGDVGTKKVAGVVHGKEFVVNAKNTRQYRPILEAINKGGLLQNNVTRAQEARDILTIVVENKYTLKALQKTNDLLSTMAKTSRASRNRDHINKYRYGD